MKSNKKVALHEELDREKESDRTEKLKGEAREYCNRLTVNYTHFQKLEKLVEKKYHVYSTQFALEFGRSKPFLIATVLKDDKYQCFRYI